MAQVPFSVRLFGLDSELNVVFVGLSVDRVSVEKRFVATARFGGHQMEIIATRTQTVRNEYTERLITSIPCCPETS